MLDTEKEKLLYDLQNENSYLPTSQALILKLMFSHFGNKCPVEALLKFAQDMDEFYPVQVFTGKLEDDYDDIRTEIEEYASNDDSEKADYINQIVMFIGYHVLYINKEKWRIYFNYYNNQNIKEEEQYSLIEEVINDILEFLGISIINVKKYTYGIDGIYNSSSYESSYYNPNKNIIYIDFDFKGSFSYETAIKIIIQSIARIICTEAIKDKYIREDFELDKSRTQEYKINKKIFDEDVITLFNIINMYYKIYMNEEIK